MANSPKKWTDVYPQGTKEGDEEQKFFIAMGRNPKYKWRSVVAIATETGLSKERVEEIISKYYKAKMVLQNPKNEDQFGYWERIGADPDDDSTIAQKDQKSRVKKAMGSAAADDDDDDDMADVAVLFSDDDDDAKDDDDDCDGGGCPSCSP